MYFKMLPHASLVAKKVSLEWKENCLTLNRRKAWKPFKKKMIKGVDVRCAFKWSYWSCIPCSYVCLSSKTLFPCETYSIFVFSIRQLRQIHMSNIFLFRNHGIKSAHYLKQRDFLKHNGIIVLWTINGAL